jgi:hypothetical protein
MGWSQKYKRPYALSSGQRGIRPSQSSDLLVSGARTMTVNVHVLSSGRNCRETIASLWNTRVTRYHVTNFLCFLGRQWLRRQRYYILAWISEC